MRWAVLVAVAACSGRDPTVVVDASQPPDIMYSLRVGQHPSRPAAEPTIYIDGVATNSVSQTYPPGETSFLHHVEKPSVVSASCASASASPTWETSAGARWRQTTVMVGALPSIRSSPR